MNPFRELTDYYRGNASYAVDMVRARAKLTIPTVRYLELMRGATPTTAELVAIVETWDVLATVTNELAEQAEAILATHTI